MKAVSGTRLPIAKVVKEVVLNHGATLERRQSQIEIDGTHVDKLLGDIVYFVEGDMVIVPGQYHPSMRRIVDITVGNGVTHAADIDGSSVDLLAIWSERVHYQSIDLASGALRQVVMTECGVRLWCGEAVLRVYNGDIVKQ